MGEKKAKGKRKGRPPLPERRRRTKNFTFRSRGDLHAQLQEASRQSLRSISQEIEHRLEQSFSDVRQVSTVLRIAEATMDRAGEYGAFASAFGLTRGAVRRPNWLDDPYGYDQAVQAANAVFEAFRPEGEIKIPRLAHVRGEAPESDLKFERLGEKIATELLPAVCDDNAEPPYPELKSEILAWRSCLGHLVERLKKRMQRK